MKRRFGGEVKYTYGDVPATSVSANSFLTTQFRVPTLQGEKLEDRSGSKVTMRSLIVNLRLQNFITPVATIVGMGANYNLTGKITIFRLNNTFQSLTLAGAGSLYVPAPADMWQITADTAGLSKTWFKRTDRKIGGWFTILKTMNFSVPPPPPPGGQLGTAIITQQTSINKYYKIRIPMNRLMEWAQDEQNSAGAVAGSLSFSTITPLNGVYYMTIHFDQAGIYSMNYRHFFNDFQ